MASCCEHLSSHFQSFRECFRSKTRSTAEQAEQYLRGLFQSPRANLEQMSETVAETEYHSLHHMLSDAAWDFEKVRRETARQAHWRQAPVANLRASRSRLGTRVVTCDDCSAKALPTIDYRVTASCQIKVFRVTSIPPKRSSLWRTVCHA